MSQQRDMGQVGGKLPDASCMGTHFWHHPLPPHAYMHGACAASFHSCMPPVRISMQAVCEVQVMTFNGMNSWRQASAPLGYHIMVPAVTCEGNSKG